jgi:hypothetical protein
MGLKILLRSWRNRERSIEGDPPDRSDLSKNTVDQGEPANDNDEVWPFIPFPDGWCGG